MIRQYTVEPESTASWKTTGKGPLESLGLSYISLSKTYVTGS